MKNSPDDSPIGRGCVEDGYAFHWPAGSCCPYAFHWPAGSSAPYFLTPKLDTVTLMVDNFIRAGLALVAVPPLDGPALCRGALPRGVNALVGAIGTRPISAEFGQTSVELAHISPNL